MRGKMAEEEIKTEDSAAEPKPAAENVAPSPSRTAEKLPLRPLLSRQLHRTRI